LWLGEYFNGENRADSLSEAIETMSRNFILALFILFMWM
jgi:hypothetical protein